MYAKSNCFKIKSEAVEWWYNLGISFSLHQIFSNAQRYNMQTHTYTHTNTIASFCCMQLRIGEGLLMLSRSLNKLVPWLKGKYRITSRNGIRRRRGLSQHNQSSRDVSVDICLYEHYNLVFDFPFVKAFTTHGGILLRAECKHVGPSQTTFRFI